MASYPNALFDMCGMMSGFAGISFWTFIGATILGKAFIKSGSQLLFVIIVCLSQMIMISYPNDIIIFIITVLCLIYTILYTVFIFTGDENVGNYIK